MNVSQNNTMPSPERLTQLLKEAIRQANITAASSLIVQIYKRWQEFDDIAGQRVKDLEAVYLTLVHHHIRSK